jgi:hypothetical protein
VRCLVSCLNGKKAIVQIAHVDFDRTVLGVLQLIGDSGIWVGDRAAAHLRIGDAEWAVVNTSKVIHADLVGVPQTGLKGHPNYLRLRREGLLSFNMVDGPAHLYGLLGPEAFVEALDFINEWRATRSVLINCDLGGSRSPTIALLYLSKRLRSISDASFDEAHSEFVVLYPRYSPGGIGAFVRQNWATIA